MVQVLTALRVCVICRNLLLYKGQIRSRVLISEHPGCSPVSTFVSLRRFRVLTGEYS